MAGGGLRPKGLNIEKSDWEAKSSGGFEILDFYNLSALDALSAFEPLSALEAFSAFYTDFLDFVSPLSYLDFFDFASLGGLSFYLDFDFDFLSLIVLFKLYITYQ